MDAVAVARPGITRALVFLPCVGAALAVIVEPRLVTLSRLKPLLPNRAAMPIPVASTCCALLDAPRCVGHPFRRTGFGFHLLGARHGLPRPPPAPQPRRFAGPDHPFCRSGCSRDCGVTLGHVIAAEAAPAEAPALPSRNLSATKAEAEN